MTKNDERGKHTDGIRPWTLHMYVSACNVCVCVMNN